MFIDDGTGRGFKAKVTSDNELKTEATTRGELLDESIRGDAYIILTTILAITNATANGILFIKNNEDRDLILDLISLLIGNTTGGAASANHNLRIYVDPSGGTLFSAGVDIVPINRNFGSSNVLSADVKELGALGQTITGQQAILDNIFPTEGRKEIAAQVVLPKGASVAFEFIAKTGNTNLDLQMAIKAYLSPEAD